MAAESGDLEGWLFSFYSKYWYNVTPNYCNYCYYCTGTYVGTVV